MVISWRDDGEIGLGLGVIGGEEGLLHPDSGPVSQGAHEQEHEVVDRRGVRGIVGGHRDDGSVQELDAISLEQAQGHHLVVQLTGEPLGLLRGEQGEVEHVG